MVERKKKDMLLYLYLLLRKFNQFSIDGVKKLDEYELDHLDGYHGSRPVRVGNGAYDHLQLDIYGNPPLPTQKNNKKI